MSARIAVIGAGPAGLAAMKNLAEEGFDVTGFEQRSEVGGIWSFTEDTGITSTTRHTKAQLSRYMTPFTDFPHESDAPLHPTAPYLASYYQSYAHHFGIYDKINFNTAVESVSRDETTSKWRLHIRGEKQPRIFDKVVFATGTENTPKYPVIDGLDEFKGTFIHSQAYKSPDDFIGKNVVVIGQGNTAGDCVVDLAFNGAANVYLAHRRGAIILPRISDGERFDKAANWRLTRFGFWLASRFPAIHRFLFHRVFLAISNKAWGVLDPAWRFDINPFYSGNISGMIVNDDLVRLLREGRIKSTHGVKRICGPRSLEMDDGTRLEDVDAIIACTGYGTSFGISSSVLSYSQTSPDSTPLPNLYRNIFPIEHADSMAFVSYLIIMESATLTRELAGMAVAQIWAGKSHLPSREDMDRTVCEQHDWFVRKSKREPLPLYEGIVDPHLWSIFVNDAAGTGINEYFGWTLKGLWFTLSEPLLYFRMTWGTNTPHMYRLFDTGKRKVWGDARDAILRANDVEATSPRGGLWRAKLKAA